MFLRTPGTACPSLTWFRSQAALRHPKPDGLASPPVLGPHFRDGSACGMTHGYLDQPIHTARLEMHARGEAGLLDVIPKDEATRFSQIAETDPLPDHRKSLLKMFKEFFTSPYTAH